jgi:hypothetical protein|nr:MAG TPA: hypothetical protein [Caudoviricetes sp.]
MLESIQSYIEYLENDTTSFDQLYQSCVMKIQDQNLEREFSYMLNNNVVSVELIDRAIVEAYKEMI